jgi:hypothetical protein
VRSTETGVNDAPQTEHLCGFASKNPRVNRFTASFRSQKKSPKANFKNASFAGFLHFCKPTSLFSEDSRQAPKGRARPAARRKIDF